MRTISFRAAFALVVVVALAAPGLASAQRGVNVDRFTPALDHQGFLTLQATRTPGPFRWNVAMIGNWTINPIVARDADGNRLSIVENRVQSHFLFQIGLAGRFALGMDVPLVLHQDGEPSYLSDGLGAIPAQAASDPRISLRWRFLGDDSRVERERNEGGGLAAVAAMRLPLGTDNSLAAEKGFMSELELNGDFHVFGAGVGAMLGWRHRTEPEIILGAPFRDEIEFGLAVKLPIPITRDFLAIAEVRGSTDPEDFFGSQTYVEGDFGLRFTRGDFSLNAGVGTGFTPAVGSPSLRTILGLYWTPRTRDADGDGIPDDRDECSYLPEDFDGFEDSDGCLDPDNDGDLIPDADDRCPNDTAEEFADEDEDGCTDPVADRDQDHVSDTEDACPDAAEDADGHQDDDGCAEADNDNDGKLDADDRCPLEPEDMDGWQDDDGCPEPDNDGDGLADAEDQCPAEAEDLDQHDDADGCPDPDDDRDGVVDAEDTCADGAETINGVDDGDGCPDRGGRAIFRGTGDRASERFELRGALTIGEGGAILATSAGAVDQLARNLISLWPHRWHVAIAGDEGPRRDGLAAALRERGVPESRFTVVSDPSLRGTRVVVRRAPPAVPSVQAPTTTAPPAAENPVE